MQRRYGVTLLLEDRSKGARNYVGEHRLVRRSGKSSRGLGIPCAHAQFRWNIITYHTRGKKGHLRCYFHILKPGSSTSG